MFYSETLLSKTGPLARVWLSANLERKLSKTHILQSNIESSVGAIVAQDQAPMALRLSGQLLLGVVRIYSRKARYLLEDCNEALMKIKMAFRPGNVDLPASATAQTSAQLTLPDVITELDLLLPDPTIDLPDLGDLPFDTTAHTSRRQDITLDSSQFLQDSVEQGRGLQDDDLLEMEDDLGLDIGEDIPAPTPRPGRATTIARASSVEMDLPSFEIGRDAPSVLAADDLFSDSRMEGLELDVTPKPAARAASPEAPEGGLGFEDDGLDLGLDDDTGMGFAGDLGLGDDTLQPPAEMTPRPEGAEGAAAGAPELGEAGEDTTIPAILRERSDSPLSSVRSSVARETSAEIQQRATLLDGSERAPTEEAEAAQAARGSRKRKVLIDAKTEIKGKQIKAQQSDHSDILIEPSFLPRDPGVLALMSLTRTGALAHSVFYPKNLAPELASLLAPEFVKRMAALKRKRELGEDAGSEAEGDETGRTPKQPRLILGEDEEEMPLLPEQQLDEGDESRRGEMLEFPEDEPAGLPFPGDESDFPRPERGSASPSAQIEEQGAEAAAAGSRFPTPAPVVVSRETRAAVHILREQFSEPAAKTTVKFQELLPPASTTKGDATKMFFEVLVLATKDAVRVGQKKGFGDIEIGQKKALWGEWAEERDEQQVAEELETEKGAAAGRGVEMIVGSGRGRVAGEVAAAS